VSLSDSIVGLIILVARFYGSGFCSDEGIKRMSALGGIYYFFNRLVDQDFLISFGDKLSSHGPDRGSEVVSGSVGVVYRAFHTNRESRLEKQPLVEQIRNPNSEIH